MSTMEEFMEKGLGDFGYKQLIQALLVSLPLFFDAQQSFISVFTDSKPTWHCTTNNNFTTSSTEYYSCNSATSNICDLSKDSWAWDVPYYKSTVSEWNLQCSSFITGLPASCYFIGCLIGGFVLSTLGDSTLGRKNMLFLSCFSMSIAALLTILSINVWIYSAFRFISGFFRAGILTCSLVLLMETLVKERRSQATLIGFLCFAIGTISLPAIAYGLDSNISNSWRSLYFWTSIPSILYCITAYFFVRESPRWLFLQGREAEAITELHKLNSSSRSHITTPLLIDTPRVKTDVVVDFGSSIKELLKRRWAWQRLVNATALAFGVGMVYYGICLGVEELNFNMYVSVALNGLMEIPSYCVSSILIEKWSRRGSILAFCVLSGICSIIMCVIVNGSVLEMVMELMSLFSVCVSFDVMLIYATEMFPTNVRNTAAGMVRQAVNLGAAVCPILVSAGRMNRFLSYGVFGIVVICSGLVVIRLPETRDMSFCDTLDEQEENK